MGWPSFAAIVSFYRGNRGNQTDFTPLGRMLVAGCFSIILGLACAAVTFIVAGLYFFAKGGPGVAAKPGTTKPNRGDALALAGAVGFIAVLAVLWLTGSSQRTKTTQESPRPIAVPQTEKQNNAIDVEAQNAAGLGRAFYEKYPDLKPYASVIDAVAAKIYESGNMPKSWEPRMEAFAKATREELARQRGSQKRVC